MLIKYFKIDYRMTLIMPYVDYNCFLPFNNYLAFKLPTSTIFARIETMCYFGVTDGTKVS